MCEQYRVNSTAGRKPGILIPNLYFYDVKYRPILRKIDKNKCWKKIVKILKTKLKKLKWAGSGPYQWAGPTRPKIHGLGSSPAQHSWLLCISTVTSPFGNGLGRPIQKEKNQKYLLQHFIIFPRSCYVILINIG